MHRRRGSRLLVGVRALTVGVLGLGLVMVPAAGVTAAGPSPEPSSIPSVGASAAPPVGVSAAPSVDPSLVPSMDPPAGATSAPLVHEVVEGLGFDHPADWVLRSSDTDMRYTRVIGFLGTAPSTAGCTTSGDTTTCRVDFALEPGTVSIALETVSGPPAVGDPFERAADPEPGTHVVLVDGMPAVRSDDPTPTNDIGLPEMSLMMPARDRTFGGTRFRARVQGPGQEVLARQVAAMFDSVHYEPALRPTDTMDDATAGAAAARALEVLTANDRAFRCFPHEPGTSRTARVRRMPFYSRLRRPVRVTCTTTIEGTAMELWRMTLTQSWTDGPGRTAGTITTTVWVGLDGEPGMSSGGGGDPPYWP